MSMTATTRETSEDDVLVGTPPTTIVENGAATTSGIIHVATENGNHHDPDEDHHIVADGEVSPSSLRRSTRASALKAQKNLKEGMGMFPPNGIEEETTSLPTTTINENGDDENIEESNDKISEPKAKKRKLMDGLELDQNDCKFGVRMDDNDVYMLSDESEISSLNSEEVGELRKNYEEFKQAGVSSQQKFERDLQVKELETQLRMEENKLILLKKTVQNQKDAEAEALKKQKYIDAANARHQMNMNAYKPTTVAPAKVNGTTTKSSKGKQNSVARDINNHTAAATPPLDPNLQRLLVQRLMANPNLAAQINLSPQLIQLLQQHQQANIQKQQPAAPAVAPTPAAPPPAPAPAPPVKKEPAVPTTTPAQRISEAKRKLRQQLDQQLLSIPPPKPLVSDINFIPSVTSDFCALLGLDLTVQRVLKDKNVFKKYEDENYVCEECGTNFTPAWKAIIGTENDLHLYCEKCVKDAQKKKMKHDHAALYKKAFVKVAEQERELENQIAAGKFDDPPAPPPPPPPPKVATPTAPKISTPNLASLHQSASAGNLNPVAALILQQQQQQHQQQQQRQKAQQQQQTSQASTSAQASTTKAKSQSKSSKRQSSSNQASSNATSSSSSSANNNQAQMLINLMRQNPMAAMMMASAGGNNPNLLQLMSLANGANNLSSNNRSSSSNNLGAFALLQAAAAANQINNSNNNPNLIQNLMNQNMLSLLMQNQNGGQNLLQSLRAHQNSQSLSKSKK